MGNCSLFFSSNSELKEKELKEVQKTMNLNKIEEEETKSKNTKSINLEISKKFEKDSNECSFFNKLKNNENNNPSFQKYLHSNELILDTIGSSERKLLPEITLLNGAIYIGEWKNGKRDGKGHQTWIDSSVYNGDWLNDQAHGVGFKKRIFFFIFFFFIYI